jgi:O-antigen/teichoic acid export membrane protein
MTGTATRDGGRLARVGLVAAIVSRIFGRLVGIVLVVVLAREASAGTVAVYGYLLGTATLVATLTDLGVAAVAGREVAAGRLPGDGALRAALGPQTISVLAAAFVTVGLTLSVGPEGVPPSALLLTVVFVVVAGYGNLWAELLRATGRVVFEGALQVCSAVALVVGGVVVVELQGDASTLLAVVVAKELAVVAVAAAVLRPRRRGVRARSLLGQSLWLAVAGIGLIVLWRQGMVVVGALGTIGALAVYVVASRFLDAGVTVAHTAGFGLVPGMSALAAEPAAFRREARRYLGLAGAVGLVVAVVGALAAGPATIVPFGARWAEAVPAVRLIALCALPMLLGYVAWTLLLARGRVRALATGSVAGALAGLAVSAVLVTARPDATSPVIGTLVGSCVLTAVLLGNLRDVLGPRQQRSDPPVAG